MSIGVWLSIGVVFVLLQVVLLIRSLFGGLKRSRLIFLAATLVNFLIGFWLMSLAEAKTKNTVTAITQQAEVYFLNLAGIVLCVLATCSGIFLLAGMLFQARRRSHPDQEER